MQDEIITTTESVPDVIDTPMEQMVVNENIENNTITPEVETVEMAPVTPTETVETVNTEPAVQNMETVDAPDVVIETESIIPVETNTVTSVQEVPTPIETNIGSSNTTETVVEPVIENQVQNTENQTIENKNMEEPTISPAANVVNTEIEPNIEDKKEDIKETKKEVTNNINPQNRMYELLVMARNMMQVRKRKKLDKIMKMFAIPVNNPNGQERRITNDEVEKLLHVSDATASRYLGILEKENKIQQHGKTGKGVFYTLR